MTKSPISNLQPLISILAICLLCAVAITPLLRSESPCTHDSGLHYFRVVAMRHALQDGILFTRYLPDLAFGYGYPFFNYREPFSYYLTLGLYLTGLPLSLTLNLIYVLSIVGSALTAYLLARDLFGPQAGVVAAVAYAYAPYQFLNALLRANMPESVALPLMPLILWGFRRLALTGHRRWFLVSVGSLAALLLAHNISSLLFVIFPSFLVAYLIVLWLVYRRGGRATAAVAWIAVGGALALALGLTAFFWGPALLERDYVQLHLSRVTRNNDFHYNFVSLAEIFAPPAPADTSLMNPPTRIHLGSVQAILGGIGLVIGLIRWRGKEHKERRATFIFSALAAIAMIWMSTRSSLWLWEHVPLLPFVQFPWRLVGRAALPVALLASAIAPTLHAPRSTPHASRITFHASRTLPLISVGLLILAALPSTYPPHGYCPSTPHPTINDLFAYEHQSGLVGVDPEGSYFPVWVKHRPEGSPLEEQYAAGSPVTRFDETTLPTGASIVEADYGPNRARVVIETPAPFRAHYLAFYFPGWQVMVNGEPVSIAPTDPEGLISFDVPAGRHIILVRFASTPIRTTFTAISLLSLVVLLALALRYPPFAIRHPPSAIAHCSLSHCSLHTILALVLLTIKLALVDRIDTPFSRPTLQPDGGLPGIEQPLNQPYADGLILIGYDQDCTMIPADGTLRIDLYWTTHARPTARYQTVIHMVGPDGMRWSLPATFRPRGYADPPPTTTWSPGRYALDSHEVEPLSGTPPGTYDIVLTVFDRDNLAQLSVLNEQGQPAAPDLTLGQVTLTRPRRREELPTHDRLDLSLDSFTLLTANFDRDHAAPGDPVFLTTFWQAKEQPTEDFAFHLTLLTDDGSPAAPPAVEYDLQLTTPWHPTSVWQPGDVWRGQHLLRLPAHLDSGDYTWYLSTEPIYQPTNLPSTIHIAAPPHTFTPPPLPHPLTTTLGSLAALVGFDTSVELLHPGDTLTVTLIWRAEDTPSISSYHVFLHLLDQEGKLIGQSDGIPANWTRPTTGWLPGEYITDVRTLTLPPSAPAGDYTLSAGLYVPGGQRLTASDGTNKIHLTIITVQAQ